MRKQNNFETMWQEEDNLWIKPYSIMTGFNSYITTIIHSPKKYFWKGPLFPEFCAFLRLICVLIVNTFGQTSCCYYYRQQTQWSRPRFTSKWRHADLTWHVTLMSRSVSRGLSVTKMRRGDRGGLWWDIQTGAQRIHDMLIKRGASNEFLHVALIKSTRDN